MDGLGFLSQCFIIFLIHVGILSKVFGSFFVNLGQFEGGPGLFFIFKGISGGCPKRLGLNSSYDIGGVLERLILGVELVVPGKFGRFAIEFGGIRF